VPTFMIPMPMAMTPLPVSQAGRRGRVEITRGA
jgi:hypothetical protein